MGRGKGQRDGQIIQMWRPRAGFRHVQEVQLYRAPTKRGAPTNDGPRVKADSNKGSLRQKGFNALDASPFEWEPP
jgi:hypothetical protein